LSGLNCVGLVYSYPKYITKVELSVLLEGETRGLQGFSSAATFTPCGLVAPFERFARGDRAEQSELALGMERFAIRKFLG
jgi:hypothetical protein